MAETFPKNLYPIIKVDRILDPNRFYAFPIIGGLIKIIMLIPVFIDLFAISIAAMVLLLINSFVVLFTGTYWKTCYELNLGLMRLSLKISFFWRGLTNKYPGFDLQIKDNFFLDIPMPASPNRLFAIPIFGGLARIILLIPYLIYTSVIQNAGNIATIVSSFAVLFKGYYPETSYELNRDGYRLSLGSSAYLSGFSDNYPNFWISMNHKNMKIFLIIIAVIWTLFSNIFRYTQRSPQRNYYPPQNPSPYRQVLPTSIPSISSQNTY